MSSGPDRPPPLARFTPAAAGVGLVTGHRFPNTWGADRRSLAEAVLAAMAAGAAPDPPCRSVMEANPLADAGVIALAADGRLGLANSRRVEGFPTAGSALRRTGDKGVAVLHNAIYPAAALAPLAAEMVLDAMAGAPPLPRLLLPRGVAVRHTSRAAVEIEGDRIVALALPAPWHGDVPWSTALGPSAGILEHGRLVGHLASDPFLIVENGRLVSADGQEMIRVPFVPEA